MPITPVFLFSAPRSGSTLVQRVIGSHDEVATTSEPWIMLPFVGPLRYELAAADERHRLIATAVEDFCRELPGGEDDYRAAVRDAAIQLYEKAAGRDTGYFVDKTPMYHLVVEEIVATFPDARFVFLWRNPLSVASSSIELFDGGRWEVNRYSMALFQSFADLVPAYERHRERAHAVRFEDLVGGDESAWRGLFEYIGVEYDRALLERFSQVRLSGRMGDPLGTKRYAELSSEPVEKWKRSITTPVRKAWCRRYLRWLGADRLATMGYSLDALLRELDAVETTSGNLVDDIKPLATSLGRELAKARVPGYSGGPSVWRMLLEPRAD